MGGMKSKRFARSFLCFSLVLMFTLAAGCAPRKVFVRKTPPLPKRSAETKGVYHVVERHQTLFRICKTYGVDLREVAWLNGISDPHKIATGQRVFIPGAKKVLKVEIYIDDIVEASNDGGEEKGLPQKLNFIWPVEGSRTDLFEEAEEKRHQGVDIASPSGTPIKASGAGRVIYSGNTIKGYGDLIIVRHSEEWATVYAHNQVNLVEEGAWVERGQIIGKVGQTGRASGPHLHFEIRRNNQAVNPMLYLK
jgi:lipoprotein NlpD